MSDNVEQHFETDIHTYMIVTNMNFDEDLILVDILWIIY